MRTLLVIFLTFTCSLSFSQDNEKEKELLLAIKKSNDFVYEANELMDDNNFISAEKEYRKAISEQPSSVAATYNLGNSYYKKGNYEAALYRQQQAAKNATEKVDKHRAFHNIGNILMKDKKCKEAVEAYKSALRNDPTDDETRYNLALAKVCAEQQKDDQPDENQDKDKQEENKDQDNKDQDQDNKDQDQDNKDDQEGKDKKDGDDKKDEGKPKDEKGKDENQEQKPQPGKLSPQQIKNLLEAMNNHEQKVQEKVNAEKQKGEKVKTDKDW